MFLMIGITDGRTDFDFCQTIMCAVCGRYGRYQVFMTYTVLSLFFIPCLKWNRHYYVKTTCCNTLYELNPETGIRIAHGDNVEITSDDLTMVRGYGTGDRCRHCSNCGYLANEDFEYCPKCGHKLN